METVGEGQGDCHFPKESFTLTVVMILGERLEEQSLELGWSTRLYTRGNVPSCPGVQGSACSHVTVLIYIHTNKWGRSGCIERWRILHCARENGKRVLLQWLHIWVSGRVLTCNRLTEPLKTRKNWTTGITVTFMTFSFTVTIVVQSAILKVYFSQKIIFWIKIGNISF